MAKQVSTRKVTELRREDGTRVRINVEIVHQSRYSPTAEYMVQVETCEKGRRTWRPVYDRECHMLRALPFGGKEREEYVLKKQLEVVTAAEIAGAALALWEQIKP